MSPRRTRNVMLRLTEGEFAALAAAVPPGEEVAVFARRALLAAVGKPPAGDGALRRAAAFIVAALAPDVGFEEALQLFDDHATGAP